MCSGALCPVCGCQRLGQERQTLTHLLELPIPPVGLPVRSRCRSRPADGDSWPYPGATGPAGRGNIGEVT